MVVGAKVTLQDDEGVITKISPFGDSFTLKLKSWEEKKKLGRFKEFSVYQQHTYKDYFDYVLRRICSGYEKFHDQVYEDILNCEKDEYSKDFKVDYHSTSLISVKYGFSQYANIRLDESFGSHNADEYISKALSVYCGKKIDFAEKTLNFWKGNFIPEAAKKENSYYFVRFKCRFRIKEGFLPFVRIKGNPFYKSTEMLESSELIYKGKTYNSVTIGDDVYTSTVILTMPQDDYQKFHEYYNTSHEKILDGCYFLPAL